MQKNIRVLCGITVLSLMPVITSAQEWSPQLSGAEQKKYRKPMQPFRINIPVSVSAKAAKQLALELDNIDVTAMMSLKGNTLIFKPVKPLEWGKHELRLVEYADDGSINERGYWSFSVRDSSLFKDVNYSADINLGINHRIADKNLGNPEPDATNGQGEAIFQTLATNQDWKVSGNLPLTYNSEKELMPNQKSLGVGNYLFSAQGSSTQINLGHHGLQQNNFIMEGFNSRGLSVSQNIGEMNSSATGFVMRSEQITGSEYGLGIEDSNNVTTGLVWESQPITNNPEKLYLSASYLSGSSDKVGESVGVELAKRQTEAWSLVTDSSLLEQQLRLRLEYASSINDIITDDAFDVGGVEILSTDIVDKSGKAVSFLATYSPLSIDPNKTFFWNVGLELNKVDTLFGSIANPNLPNDKKLTSLFFNADWSGVSAQLMTSKETDNVDNDELRPEIETKTNQLTLNYSLSEQPKKDSFFGVIGIPSFSFQWIDSTFDQISEASSSTVLFEDLDAKTNTYLLAANFNNEKLNWGLTYTENKLKDSITPTNNTVTRSHMLNADYRVNKYLSITPVIQKNRSDLSQDGSHAKANLYDLGIGLQFTGDLSGRINLRESQTIINSQTNQDKTEVSEVSMQFSWQWIKPKINKPGFNINLTGTYQDSTNNNFPENNIETYQVYLGCTMTLPLTTVK